MTNYLIRRSKAFKKSLKKLDEKSVELVAQVINKLANDEGLDAKHKDHALKGKFKDFRECHIKPDLLLIYQKQDDLLVLLCIDVGSHSELFG